MPEQRQFPPPWTVEEGPACFIVRLRIFGDSDFNPKLSADPATTPCKCPLWVKS
jgi:hypothetical protein